MTTEETGRGPWGVRKTRFGRVAFEVVQIVRETAQTHSVHERDYRGTWGKRAWLTRAPFEGFRDGTISTPRGVQSEVYVWPFAKTKRSADIIAYRVVTPSSDWPPIETHDGSRAPVMLWFPDLDTCEVQIGAWRPWTEPYGGMEGGDWIDRDTGEPFETMAGPVFPTHWRPLPTPPEAKS